MNQQFRHGYGLRLQPQKPEDAVFGRIFKGDAEPVDWRPFLPTIKERQYNSQFCTNFSYTNVLETIVNRMKFLNGTEQYNLSDRWNAVKSGTNPIEGNTLQNACHAGLKEGNVLEEECPWKEGWLNNVLAYWNEIIDLSKISPKQVFPAPNYSLVSPNDLKRALAYSPLQVGVKVGETWSDSIVKPPKQEWGGHAVVLAFIDEQGYKYIFDTDEPFIKKLSPDYPILVAMSFATLPANWEELNMQNIPTIQKKIIELMKKVISLLKNLISIKTMPEIIPPEPMSPVPEPKPFELPKIQTFATAIEKYEGFTKGSRSYRNNNSGNLKFSDYVQSLGAKGKDKDNFAIFDTYQEGYCALCCFLYDACQGNLIPYRKGNERPSSFTIQEFFEVYAPASDKNYPKKYATFVAKQLGVIPSDFIKNMVG